MIHVQLNWYVTFSRKWLRPCHAKRHHTMPGISSFIYLLYIFVRNIVNHRAGIYLVSENKYTYSLGLGVL